jgi:hypothetical protein
MPIGLWTGFRQNAGGCAPRLLLGTHLLLWAAGTSDQLSEDPQSELVFSLASLWELSIKRSLGRVISTSIRGCSAVSL